MPMLIDGKIISDFRSDTVTRPTPEMRQAMAEAVVGDDVFEDDPTVRELENEAAGLFGKEAGLYVPSGTMANLIAVKVHTKPGDEILLEARCHTYNHEVGGVAQFAGVLTRTLNSDQGKLDPEEVAGACRQGDLHLPHSALLSVENTHNYWGGRVIPLEHMKRLFEVTREKSLALHIDGARIFNAITASGTSASDWGAVCDSLSFCLSKGLGAPVGSVMVGSREFVGKARRVRKVLGGGMRQAGVIAAAGLVALRHGPERLPIDHENARALVEGLAQIEGAVVEPDACETNILFVHTKAGPASYEPIVQALGAEGILAFAEESSGMRFVTHRDLDRSDVERALKALGRLIPAHCS